MPRERTTIRLADLSPAVREAAIAEVRTTDARKRVIEVFDRQATLLEAMDAYEDLIGDEIEDRALQVVAERYEVHRRGVAEPDREKALRSAEREADRSSS